MIDSLRDLKKLIALCRTQGVETIEFSGVKLTLSPSAPKETKRQAPKVNHYEPIAPGGITDDTRIITEGLTEEQLLFYSADPTTATEN